MRFKEIQKHYEYLILNIEDLVYDTDNIIDLLNKYLYNSSDEEIAKLQLNEIYKLKDAIKQDKIAIDFVLKLCQKYESSKKALEKLKTDGAQI